MTLAFHLELSRCDRAEVEPIRVILPPTADTTRVENLFEAAEYLASLTAVTQEYLSLAGGANDWRQTGLVPNIVLKQTSPTLKYWLPASSIVAMTSGSRASRNLSVITRFDHSLLSILFTQATEAIDWLLQLKLI